jgi:hypothetical protein
MWNNTSTLPAAIRSKLTFDEIQWLGSHAMDIVQEIINGEDGPLQVALGAGQVWQDMYGYTRTITAIDDMKRVFYIARDNRENALGTHEVSYYKFCRWAQANNAERARHIKPSLPE